MEIMVIDIVRLASNSIEKMNLTWLNVSYVGPHCEQKIYYINAVVVILTAFKIP